MIDKVPTVSVVIALENKVVLVEHLEGSRFVGYYSLPGGALNQEETAQQTLVRKIGSETGLVTRENWLANFPRNNFEAEMVDERGKLKLYTMRVFICTKFEGTLKFGQWEQPIWAKINELDNYKLLPNTKEAVLNALNI